jgi:uncharacterized protein (DUF1501 family)
MAISIRKQLLPFSPSPALPHSLSRRNLLQLGFLGGIGLSLADYLRLAEASPGAKQARADACIFLHLKGGPSHLDTLDMKPEAPVEEQGPFKRIQTVVPGYEVCEYLPRLAKFIDRFTLVRGISHSAGAHPQANEYLFTGNRPTPALVYPCMGSVAAKELSAPPAMPPFVTVPNSDMSPGHLGVSYGAFKTTAVPKAGQPFSVRGLALAEGETAEKVQARNELLADLNRSFRQQAESPLVDGLDRFGQQARDMILSDRARQAFDISRESPAILKLFEDDPISQSLLLAGRLVEHGVRFVTVTHDGWDTHLDNFTSLEGKLLPPFDAGITSLVQALELKGLLDRVLVVATGEFGRTPAINKNAGRDHWPRTMWTLVAGGGTKRNFFLGGTDKQGHAPDDDTHLKPDDLAASIYHSLGIDPRLEYYTRTGRPVLLVPEGQVIRELFA